jgi:hypothetical protein
MLLIKLIKNKSRHNLINNLSSVTCFGFVSCLQARYTIVVLTRYRTPRRIVSQLKKSSFSVVPVVLKCQILIKTLKAYLRNIINFFICKYHNCNCNSFFTIQRNLIKIWVLISWKLVFLELWYCSSGGAILHSCKRFHHNSIVIYKRVKYLHCTKNVQFVSQGSESRWQLITQHTICNLRLVWKSLMIISSFVTSGDAGEVSDFSDCGESTAGITMTDRGEWL